MHGRNHSRNSLEAPPPPPPSLPKYLPTLLEEKLSESMLKRQVEKRFIETLISSKKNIQDVSWERNVKKMEDFYFKALTAITTAQTFISKISSWKDMIVTKLNYTLFMYVTYL